MSLTMRYALYVNIDTHVYLRNFQYKHIESQLIKGCGNFYDRHIELQ